METETGTEIERNDCETKGIWAGKDEESSTEQKKEQM